MKILLLLSGVCLAMEERWRREMAAPERIEVSGAGTCGEIGKLICNGIYIKQADNYPFKDTKQPSWKHSKSDILTQLFTYVDPHICWSYSWGQHWTICSQYRATKAPTQYINLSPSTYDILYMPPTDSWIDAEHLDADGHVINAPLTIRFLFEEEQQEMHERQEMQKKEIQEMRERHERQEQEMQEIQHEMQEMQKQEIQEMRERHERQKQEMEEMRERQKRQAQEMKEMQKRQLMDDEEIKEMWEMCDRYRNLGSARPPSSSVHRNLGVQEMQKRKLQELLEMDKMQERQHEQERQTLEKRFQHETQEILRRERQKMLNIQRRLQHERQERQEMAQERPNDAGETEYVYGERDPRKENEALTRQIECEEVQRAQQSDEFRQQAGFLSELTQITMQITHDLTRVDEHSIPRIQALLEVISNAEATLRDHNLVGDIRDRSKVIKTLLKRLDESEARLLSTMIVEAKLKEAEALLSQLSDSGSEASWMMIHTRQSDDDELETVDDETTELSKMMMSLNDDDYEFQSQLYEALSEVTQKMRKAEEPSMKFILKLKSSTSDDDELETSDDEEFDKQQAFFNQQE